MQTHETTHITPTVTPGQPVRIGDLLITRGVITQEQVDQALAFQRDRGHRKLLGEVLVELELVTEEQLLLALAEAYDVPHAHLTPRMIDRRAVELLERDFMEDHSVLPLFNIHGKLTVAISEPSNVFLIEEIERLTHLAVQPVIATARNIAESLRQAMPDSNTFVIDNFVDDIQAQDLTVVEQEVTDLSNLEGLASDSPVIKLVNYFIYTAVQDGASDIHIEPDEARLRVRYRVDGRLFEKMSPPCNMLPAIVSRVKIMSNLDISERRVPQDGAISVMIDGRPVDLRVSTMPGKFGEKIVMRVIDNSATKMTLDKLGFCEDILRGWRHVVHQPNGVVLVTGPTGSGKSTTLYSSLSEINTEAVNISTVEDPVEYNLPGVNQFQVNEKAGFTFSGALRALLRQDPDIIMLGEIRDQETAKIATQAALTGHLVLSTLHTNDSPSAVTRLFNIGVEPYLVAAAIRGVLAQRLLRKICTHCKEAIEPTPQQRTALERIGGDDHAYDTIFKGHGCAKCRDTGYSGRVGIYELFIPDDEALDVISRGGGLQELRRIAKASGMRTLSDDALDKVLQGVTSMDELFNITV